jgi:hypothetical protein
MSNIANIRGQSVPQKGAPRVKLDYDVPGFGGWDSTSDPAGDPPLGMEDIDSPDTLNTVYDKPNSVATRQGYIKLLTTKAPSFIGGMYSLYQSTGTRQMVFASNTNLYTYNNAGGSTVINGTGGTPMNFTANQQWAFDEYMDTIYAGDGVDPLVAYNGSSVVVANAGITPQFVKIRTNRVYCANKGSSVIYFSDAGNPTSFPVNNFIQINTNDGQNITGLSALVNNLVVFKDESVWIMTGEPLGAGNTTTIGNLQLRQANSSVGCSAFRTICQIDELLFFVHYSGIYVLQNYSVQLVSPDLQFTFDNSINPGYISSMYGVYNALRKKYIIGYPSATSTVCDSAIVYDLLVKKFSRWDHIPGSCMINFKFSGQQENVFMGDPSQGNIYEMFQGYSDIAGYTNQSPGATGGSTTTLVDTNANWTSNQFVDCRVMIGNNLGAYQIAIVQSNTNNTLTFTTAISAPASGTPYSIGYYTSYWTTKWFDFEATGYTKKYRYFNLFSDNQSYPILFGSAMDFGPIAFQKQFKMGAQPLFWDSGLFWDTSGLIWDSNYGSVFGQANIGGTGRYVAAIFGNNLALQPWRAIKYSFNYKQKKERTNIVTT